MNYEPTNWQTGDLITAGKLNHLEQGIAALYPQTQIIAPEQTVTITAEDTHGVAIALADGYTLPETLPDNWTVVVNGHILPYVHRASEGSYNYTDATQSPSVFWQVVLYEGQLWLYVAQPAQTIRPGDYTVKIIGVNNPPTALPDASDLEDGEYRLSVSNGKWVVEHTES